MNFKSVLNSVAAISLLAAPVVVQAAPAKTAKVERVQASRDAKSGAMEGVAIIGAIALAALVAVAVVNGTDSDNAVSP